MQWLFFPIYFFFSLSFFLLSDCTSHDILFGFLTPYASFKILLFHIFHIQTQNINAVYFSDLPFPGYLFSTHYQNPISTETNGIKIKFYTVSKNYFTLQTKQVTDAEHQQGRRKTSQIEFGLISLWFREENIILLLWKKCMYVYIFLIFRYKMSQFWLQAAVATAVEISYSHHNHCVIDSRCMPLQFLLHYQTFGSLRSFLEKSEIHNQNIIILQWIVNLLCRAWMYCLIFSTSQQTFCRVIQLDNRKNVNSALRKQTEEYLESSA